MKQRILIFGSGGMLGREFLAGLADEKNFFVSGCDRRAADITNPDAVRRAIRRIGPDVVINCAASISVEGSEADPLAAWRVNAMGPGIIGEAMHRLGSGALFVHISTCDVFGNDQRSFGEDDRPSPVNVYGWSKLGGEKIIEAVARARGVKYVIIRTHHLYSRHRPTFVDAVAASLLRRKPMAVVGDQYVIPTWTRDVVSGVRSLIRGRAGGRASGIYHLTPSVRRPPTRYQVAQIIAEMLGLDPGLLKKSRQRDVFRVPRPKSAILVNTKGISMPSWRDSLRHYLVERYAQEARIGRAI